MGEFVNKELMGKLVDLALNRGNFLGDIPDCVSICDDDIYIKGNLKFKILEVQPFVIDKEGIDIGYNFIFEIMLVDKDDVDIATYGKVILRWDGVGTDNDTLTISNFDIKTQFRLKD